MEENNIKKRDIHGTSEMTRWVHHHRTLAKWLMKFLVAGVASILYYLKREQRHIEEEGKNK